MKTINVGSYYNKFGLYAWDTTWQPEWSQTRTIHTKGSQIIRDAAGTPTLTPAEVLTLIDSSYTPPVDPPPVQAGVLPPLVARVNWVDREATGAPTWLAYEAATTPPAKVRGPRRARLRS